jgi:ABC-2 type transport system ATP-binding protein
MATDPPPLWVEGLTVTYGERLAVDHLSFTVRRGEIYGLLGSNGAGKTSTIKSVVGLVRPATGRVLVYGRDAVTDSLRVKQEVGYVPETSLLYEALTPREFLEFVASVRHLDPATASERTRNYATAFRLEAEFEEPIVTLSNGTRQKVLLIAALLHQPPLLVLDEPLNSLDPCGS